MDMWNTDTPIRDIEGLNVTIPAWIDQDITPYDVAAIIQGGCASGAYMPAVTYYAANKTMSEHGDGVLDYIQSILGDLPTPRDDESWSGLAAHYLSCAIQLWASGIEDDLEAFDIKDAA